MKKTVLFLFLLMPGQYLSAQNQVSGTVTDQSKSPLIGAAVYLPEINKGTLTDEKGHFQITGLPDGNLKIQFSYVGYINRVETIVLNHSDINLDIELTASVIKTDEVVVTGGYSSTQHENAVKIEALKLDLSDIKSTPNFSDVITKIPGVNMISKGSGVSKPVIRGLSMNDILVLNNGVRIENYQYSDHHPLGIDEFGIEDVEVIKGPASLLYGSDAIGGVVNFLKEKPAPVGMISGDFINQFFSNTLGITTNLGIKGSSQHFSGGIRTGQKSNSDFLQGGGAYAPNSRFNEQSLKLSAGLTTKILTSKLYYDWNKQNLGLVEPEAIDLIKKRSRKVELYYERFNSHLLSSQNKLYLGKMKMDINSSYQSTGLAHFGEQNFYELQMKLTTFMYETRLYLPSDKNSEYIAGFQGMNQKNMNFNNRPTILLPDAGINNLSAFLLAQRTFLGKLKVQAGVRYDNRYIATKSVGNADSWDFRGALRKNYNNFSGSVGATLNLTGGLLFRANFASAYRTPNLAELTSKGVHELRYEIGDNDLKPENSGELDLSMHIHKENFTFDLSGFYNNIKNYIFIIPTADSAAGVRIYRYTQHGSVLSGAEAGLHYHPADKKWFHIVSTFSTVTGKQKNNIYLPFIPGNKFYFEIRMEKENIAFLTNTFFVINTTTVFKQHNPAPGELSGDRYTLLDISVGGDVKIKNQNFSFIVASTNVLDKKYIDHMSSLKEVNINNPGRNICLTLKIPFEFKRSV